MQSLKILLGIITISLLGLMQVKGQTLDFKNSRKILLGGQEQSKQEIFKIMETHPEALQLYKEGKNLRTWGDVTFFGGLGIAVGGVLLNSLTNIGSKDKPIKGGYYGSNPTYKETNYTLSIVSLVVGGGLLAATIPLKISGKKKIRQSVEMYNNDVGKTVSEAENRIKPQFFLIADNKGTGIRILF